MAFSKKIGLLIAPLLFFVVLNLPFHLVSETGDAVIAVAIWMVLWWITEAVHIAVTALLPLILFPLLKVMPAADVGANYGSPIIFLFFGGFILALALEKVNLHKRIALTIIKMTGTTPNKVILGFMIATAFMSMWISNTASTVVMLPIAISVIKLLIDGEDGFTKGDKNFALSIMLGIAFSANAGGVATVIGTPPNSVLIGLLESEYNTQISFLKWMTMGLPFSIMMVSLCYLVLVKIMFPCNNIKFSTSANVISDELKNLGKISKQEKRVLTIFAITVSLWITRTLINYIFPGLQLSDTIISLIGAISLFAIPMNFKKGDFVLHWNDTSKLAWGILLLFGGGLAIAQGFQSSGLANWIAENLTQLNGFSLFIILLVLITAVNFLTEITSNLATTAMLLPILAPTAVILGVHPYILMVGATLAASCAFMLPVATPPNAVVFGSNYLKISDMVRVGILMNIISIIIIFMMVYFILPILWNFNAFQNPF